MSEGNIIARPYAKAIFELAIDAQQIAPWGDLLLEAGFIASDPHVKSLIDNPRINEEQVAEFILGILGNETDHTFRNFICLLAEKKRLAYLPATAQLFQTYRDEYEKILDVDVMAAYPMSEEQTAQLKQSLTKRFHRKIKLTLTQDKSLIGGAMIRAGDTVIDGSAKGKLSRLVNYLSLKENLCQQ